jgi:hypothetical protein
MQRFLEIMKLGAIELLHILQVYVLHWSAMERPATCFSAAKMFTSSSQPWKRMECSYPHVGLLCVWHLSMQGSPMPTYLMLHLPGEIVSLVPSGDPV